MAQKSTIRDGGPGCAGIAPGHPSATPTHQHQGTLSLVIPALRQGVRGQGEKSFPLPYDRRLSLSEVVQGFAPPGTPFVTASADKPGSRPLTCRGFRRGLMTRKSKKPLGVRLSTQLCCVGLTFMARSVATIHSETGSFSCCESHGSYSASRSQRPTRSHGLAACR